MIRMAFSTVVLVVLRQLERLKGGGARPGRRRLGRRRMRSAL